MTTGSVNVKETAWCAPYAQHVNPHWVRLLELLQMNENYVRCAGAELFTAGGRRVLDFLSGYCVHNAGHNHPAIVSALLDELRCSGAAMVQSNVSTGAGELAGRLCRLAGGRLRKAFFASSGSEGIEAAIKFSRAHTKRSGLVYAEGAFHGLTCGALSLMGNAFWRTGFEPLLPGAEQVPFGNLAELERVLSTRRVAAFIVEPIQGEGGVRVPDPDYLRAAEMLCRRFGTLLILDEVQTGLYRTGTFLAAHQFGVDPDMVVLAKSLSGGLVPSGAVLMSDAVYESVYGGLGRAIVHTSTYSENGLAMRAGLATLDVLEAERLGSRALSAGESLRAQLDDALSGYEMFEETRGVGLLCGVAFRAPQRLTSRLTFNALSVIHPAVFGQILVMRMFRDRNILTQICGNSFMVLKVTPPLVVDGAQIGEFVSALKQVVEEVHASSTFWSEALGLARRAVGGSIQ
jgi:ornithine--oxo-acid transaminase